MANAAVSGRQLNYLDDFQITFYFEETMANQIDQVCRNCKYWNFKVSADKSFGECLNPRFIENMRISTSLIHDETVREELKYARLQTEENNFGCRFFEIEPMTYDIGDLYKVLDLQSYGFTRKAVVDFKELESENCHFAVAMYRLAAMGYLPLAMELADLKETISSELVEFLEFAINRLYKLEERKR